MSDAPEKIWVRSYGGGNGGVYSTVDMSDVGLCTEYTRTDTIPSAAYVAGLEAALKGFIDETLDYMDINSLGDPEKQHTVKQARAALASRPASPDVRVVTVEQLEAWSCRLPPLSQNRAEIRAIIGGQP